MCIYLSMLIYFSRWLLRHVTFENGRLKGWLLGIKNPYRFITWLKSVMSIQSCYLVCLRHCSICSSDKATVYEHGTCFELMYINASVLSSLTSRARQTGSSSMTCSHSCAPPCRSGPRRTCDFEFLCHVFVLSSLVLQQNVLRKVQHQDALQISDVVMASLLRMFQSTAGSGGVQEDALMAVSTLVEGEGLHIPNACKEP